MAPLGISSRSVLGIAQRSPSTLAEGSRKEASGASRTRCRLEIRPPSLSGCRSSRRCTTRMASTPTAAARHVLNSQRNRPPLAAIGVVAGVDVADAAVRAAEIGMRSRLRRAVSRKLDASASQRCVAPGVHPPAVPLDRLASHSRTVFTKAARARVPPARSTVPRRAPRVKLARPAVSRSATQNCCCVRACLRCNAGRFLSRVNRPTPVRSKKSLFSC